jgi:hypothetical protein
MLLCYPIFRSLVYTDKLNAFIDQRKTNTMRLLSVEDKVKYQQSLRKVSSKHLGQYDCMDRAAASQSMH